jgi:hypothetical protein
MNADQLHKQRENAEARRASLPQRISDGEQNNDPDTYSRDDVRRMLKNAVAVACYKMALAIIKDEKIPDTMPGEIADNVIADFDEEKSDD